MKGKMITVSFAMLETDEDVRSLLETVHAIAESRSLVTFVTISEHGVIKEEMDGPQVQGSGELVN